MAERSPAIPTGPAVVELRQYTLRPGERARFAELFDRELVHTQEAVGIRVVGQFLDLDRPDVFVWLRAFPDMAARAQALHDFYYGPVWARYRGVANPMMLDSDDVLLLEPCEEPVVPHPDGDGPIGMVEVDIWAGAGDRLLARHRASTAPALRAAGARPLAELRTLHAVNTFPALPVRDGSFAVAVTAFRSPADAAEVRRCPPVRAAADELPPAQRLRLTPTAGSALR